jgi:CubicO group peptidase (beta-lactamase class C family)
MRHSRTSLVLSFLFSLPAITNAACYEPSPAFLPPKLDPADSVLQSAFKSLAKTIEAAADDDTFNGTSFSVEVTSLDGTLWSHHHTAKLLNSSRPGADPVTDQSFYRIASITKTFTTLALLEHAAAGTLDLDDPVNKYLPELRGAIPWKDITLRTLASQLSGIPRDCIFKPPFSACQL